VHHGSWRLLGIKGKFAARGAATAGAIDHWGVEAVAARGSVEHPGATGVVAVSTVALTSSRNASMRCNIG